MKKILLLLCVVFAFVVSVFGTDSRIASLGIPAWMVYDDDALVKLYPGLVADSKNTIVFNSNSSIILDSISMFDLMFVIMGGGSPDVSIINKITIPESGYITLNLNSFVLGVFAFPYKGVLLYKPSTMVLDNLVTNSVGGATHTVFCPDRVYGVLFGLGIDDLSIGATLGIGDKSSSYKEKYENSGSKDFDEMTNSSLAINLGIGASMPIFDLGINVSLPMVDNKGTTSFFDDTIDKTTIYMNETVKTDSGYDLGVNARVILSSIIIGGEFAMDNVKLVNIQQRDRSSPYDGDFTDASDNNEKEVYGRNIMQIKGGVSGNLSLASDKITLIPGLMVNYTTINQINEYTNINTSSSVYDSFEINLTMMSIALNLSAEGKISDALVARAGISKNVYNNMKVEIINNISGGTKLDPARKQIIELAYLNSINLSGGISVNIGAATVEATVTGGINIDNLPIADIGSLNIKIPGSIASQISAKYTF